MASKNPKEVNLSFRVSNKLKKQLTEYCEEKDLRMSIVIRDAIECYIENLNVYKER